MSWRNDVQGLPNFAPAEFELEAAKTGLLVVDMQYVDAHRDYALGKSLRESHPTVWEYYFTRLEEHVIPNTRRLLDAFRGHGMRVIYLTVGPELPDGADMVALRRPKNAPGLRPMLYHKGTFEHEILEELAPAEGELIINKTSRSAFNSTAIERVLLNLGLDALVVCGVSTSSCVETTARDAADRGFRVVVVEDATAELDEPSHDATLRQFAVRWGRVWTTDETVNVLAELNVGAVEAVAVA
jgi:nicotinamidase-related amidase